MTNHRSNRTRALFVGACAVALAALAAKKNSLASDHRDSESLANDPGVDVTDVFAFMRPEGTAPNFTKSSHLVLVMNVHPSAPRTAQFEENVDYTLDVVDVVDPAAGITGMLDATVTCRFFAPTGADDAGLPAQPFTCAANGTFFSGTTNTITGAANDALRVFAGLRSDPAFGAVPQILSSIGAGHLPAADGGANAFAGQNVLSIVADVDVARVLLGDAGPTLLGVSASTERQ